MRVIVVGAGVIGLTVGVRLREAGFEAHVVARDLPLETTSAVAAAIWYPYLAFPRERVLVWSTRTLEVLDNLAASDPAAGVTVRLGTELVREPASDPWWADAVPALRSRTDVPAPYRQGWTFATPIVEMPVYLGWLVRRFVQLGGTVTRMTLAGLPDRADVVVNCSGLGARGLVGDTSVEPVRGQVLTVAPFGLDEWLLDTSGPTYVVPRSNDVVIGGTELAGRWDRRVDVATSQHILDRATALLPELKGVEVLSSRVGLRPARPAVRLESERTGGGCQVIHCYGHGGAGVTLSWGCADEVVELVESGS